MYQKHGSCVLFQLQKNNIFKTSDLYKEAINKDLPENILIQILISV